MEDQVPQQIREEKRTGSWRDSNKRNSKHRRIEHLIASFKMERVMSQGMQWLLDGKNDSRQKPTSNNLKELRRSPPLIQSSLVRTEASIHTDFNLVRPLAEKPTQSGGLLTYGNCEIRNSCCLQLLCSWEFVKAAIENQYSQQDYV